MTEVTRFLVDSQMKKFRSTIGRLSPQPRYSSILWYSPYDASLMPIPAFSEHSVLNSSRMRALVTPKHSVE
jgi:hypothetical protein